MKVYRIVFFMAFLLMSVKTFSQDVVGIWKTYDDKTGKERSHVKIYKNKNGVVFGRIVKVMDPKLRGEKCTQCPNQFNCFAKKGDKIQGMLIIRGLEKDGDEYTGGRIFSPYSSKIYKCYIKLENKNKLKVRGFLGSRYMGGTRYWYRLN